MRKHWRITAVAAVLVLALAVGFVPLIRSGNTAAEAAAEWSDSGIQSEYGYGTVLTLPQRTVTVDGETAAAVTVLQFPDGSATRATTATLGMSGIYTLTYSATVAGRAYAETEQFTVRDDLVTFGSADSSYTYGSYVTNHDGVQHTNKAGLMVRLAEGDTMTLTPIIDVRDISVDDILVEAFATPDIEGMADFKRLYFTFTDVSDPSVYMRVSVRHSDEGDNYPNSYFLAAGNGQQLTGYEAGWDRLHIDNEWGAQAPHSFTLLFGANNSTWTEPENAPIRLRYDASNLMVYTGNTMIIDFDNPDYFNTLWHGFPSGYVRMSVSAAMYNTTTANFCITDVFGIDLTAEHFVDDVAPDITVDCAYAADDMPEAEVGGTYPVPSASAYDLYSGTCTVKTSVYYNYSSDNAVLVDITDGRFATERAGWYAIVYTAADRQGKEAEEILWVHASETVAEPTVTLNGAYETSMTVGDRIEPVAYETTCASGNAAINITATLDDGTVYNMNDGMRIERAGTYTVTYTATDYIGQTGTATYTVTATMGNTPVFTETPAMPRYFVSGSAYTLPEVYATDYRSGTPERKLASAEITDAAGTRTVQAGESFTPQVNNNGDTVTVTFTCEGAEYDPIEIPAIIAWIEDEASGRPRLQLTNYLYSADGGITAEGTADNIVVTAASANGGWTWANRQLAYDIELRLGGIVGRSSYTGLDIVFTDAADPSISLTVSIRDEAAETRVYAGGTSLGLSGSLAAGDAYTVGYYNGSITVNGTTVTTVTTDDSGRAFTGFPSGYVYAGVYFDNATVGSAAYRMLSYNGHTLNNGTTDRVLPNIIIYGDYGGSFNIGETVTLPAADACDAVDPNVTLSMTVTDGNGNIVTDVDDTALSNVDPRREYTIVLNEYGQYNVRITAADTFNQRANTANFPYALNVDDDVAPEITFSGNFQTTAVVGDVLVMPDFTVSDNITAAENIVVTKYVLTPKGVLVTLSGNSNSIRTAYEGVYEFRIIAFDAAGNVTMIRQAVTVTAAASTAEA